MRNLLKNKKLAKISQYIAKTKTKIYQRLRNLLKSIYLSRFFVFLRPFFDRIRKIFRPIYQWIKPKIISRKILIYYILGLGVIFGIILTVFFFDLNKDYGFDPIETADYSEVDWNGKIDNNGYSYSRAGDFKWKVVITPPNKSFIFKPSKQTAEVKMLIKDLHGSIQIPAGIKIVDQEGNTSQSKRITSLAHQKKATLVSTTNFTSILGLSFISPTQGNTIGVNGGGFNTATIQLPQNTKVIKFGDQNLPNSYKINERNIFFHSFSNAAVVYYHKDFHIFMQIAILLVAIAGLLLTLFINKINIKRIRFSYKDFIAAGLLVIISMALLAILIPNPNKLIVSMSDTIIQIPKENNTKTYRLNQFPRYLRWVLFVNQSIDSMVVGNVNNCSLSEIKLGQIGIQKFIILDQYKSNACAQKIISQYPQKVIITSQEDLSQEIKNIKNRDYRYNSKLFKYNAKIIFLLSNILLAITCAFLIWQAFNIKKLKDVLFFITYAFSSYFLIIGIYIFIGALARMPIGYHGTSDIGLIMSNYFLPGTISGGNNLRTLFAFIGLIFIVITSIRVFKKLEFRLFFGATAIICILMIIPQTEYHTKRFVLSGFSAEAYMWDYKMDVFNSLDFYKSIREATIVDYYKKVTDRNTYGNRDIDYAVALQTENRIFESQKKLQAIITEYSDEKSILARARFELGNLYLKQAKSKNNINLKKSFIEDESYYKLALDEYINFIDEFPGDSHTPKAIDNIANIYLKLEEYEKAIRTLETAINLYPNASYIGKIKLDLAQMYYKLKDFSSAIEVYKDILNNDRPTNYIDIEILLAQTYIKNKNETAAIKIFQDILDKNIIDLETEIKILKQLEKTNKYKNDPNIKTITQALYLEYWGKNKEALRQYINIENNIENNLFGAIIKYRASQLLKNAVSYLESKSNIKKINEESLTKLKQISDIYPESNISLLSLELLGYVDDIDFENQPDYQIFINNEFELDSNEKINEVLTVDNVILKINKVDNKCGNNKCEINETNSNCSKDCDADDNKISINAHAQKVNEGSWPYLQLWINENLTFEHQIDSEIASSFYFPLELVTSDYYDIKLKAIGEQNSQIFIKDIGINQINYPINKTLSGIYDSSKDISFLSEAETLTLSEKYPTVKLIKNTTDKILDFVLPFNLEIFIEDRIPSRGMTLYFSGIICFLFILLYTKNLRTFITPFFMLFIARGILRVAEQDPFRAWNSIYPGVLTGLQLTAVFIIFSACLYFLGLVINIILKKIRLYMKNKLI